MGSLLGWQLSSRVIDSNIYTSTGSFDYFLLIILVILFWLLQVSPADGRVLHFGVVDNDMVEQVKGITYSMKTFLGPDQLSASTLKELDSSDNKSLYHCVIYLGPGDYHSFHSPSEWNVKLRRHFPG